MEFLDYREYLKYFYETKKKEKSYFSYKLIGNKVGIDPSYLYKVFARTYHIADQYVPAFAKLCEMDTKEAEYFEVLVHFGKARTAQESKVFFDHLMSMRGIQNRVLVEAQFRYYQHWYNVAIRSLLGVIEFKGDFEELSRLLDPAITVDEAKEAIQTLEALKLVHRNNLGAYELSEPHVTTGPDMRSAAIRHFQKDMMHLAERSLDEHPKEVRDISTVTMALRRSTLQDIREILRTAREDIQKRVGEDDGVECVYQLNLQFFPLTLLPEPVDDAQIPT